MKKLLSTIIILICLLSAKAQTNAAYYFTDFNDANYLADITNAIIYTDTNATARLDGVTASVSANSASISANTSGVSSLTGATNQYQLKGGNIAYGQITNQPSIPSTNGFVNSSITNGLLGSNSTNGFVNASITNGLLGANATNGFVGTNYVITNINASALTLSNAVIGDILSVFTNQSLSLNTTYSNATGFLMTVSGLIVIYNEGAIAGRCSGKLSITGQNGFTNTFNTPTYTLLSGGSVTNPATSFSVATNGTFSVSDTSTGAGNSISVVPLVQIVY